MNEKYLKALCVKKNINNVRTKPQQTLYSHKYITDFISAIRFKKNKDRYYCDLEEEEEEKKQIILKYLVV